MKALPENHTTVKRLEKLANLAIDLGIAISTDSSGSLIINDLKTNETYYYVEEPNFMVYSFPHNSESKLLIPEK